ncbi:MAG TPA: hypothetical protein VKC90_11435, partial [Chitinophagaceae bacterium]|nr:hypothetical protein [Chitinophagaceae bacterium]
YCLRLLFMGYRLFYNESLRFVHFIPSHRLTEEYINGLGEGFKSSYEILSKYSLLLYLQSSSKIQKIKTILFSIIKFFLSSIISTKKWNKNYDAMVIYFLTNYKLKFVTKESIMIKTMYLEFKSSGHPEQLKSVVSFMHLDVLRTSA